MTIFREQPPNLKEHSGVINDSQRIFKIDYAPYLNKWFSRRVINLDGLENVVERLPCFRRSTTGGDERQLDNLVGQFVIVEHPNEIMPAVGFVRFHRDGIVIANARRSGNADVHNDALPFAPFHFVAQILRDGREIIRLRRNPHDESYEREVKRRSPKGGEVGRC